MQTLVTCMECQVLDGRPNLSSLQIARVPDDGLIAMTCNRGHQTFAVIQQMKFELLSEMAIQAVVDGYYRDAIASFTAALERLYEFFINAACRKHGVDSAAFVTAWKGLANHSERQVGAFVSVHLMDTGYGPQLMKNKHIELRNAVVHKGQLASREEAVTYGQAALECARPILDLLRSETFVEPIRSLVMGQLRGRYDIAHREGARGSTCSVATFFSLTDASSPTDVETAIARCAAQPDLPKSVAEANALGEVHDLFRELQSIIPTPAKPGPS